MEAAPTPRNLQPLAPTVLLVEDEPSVHQVLERWLTESGWCVVACRSFEDARAYLAGHTPDVLVTDIRLKDYNGLQLVMHMGKRNPMASCLVITGHDDPVLRREAEHMHARYLLKPFGRDEFLDALKNLRSPVSPQSESVEMAPNGHQ